MKIVADENIPLLGDAFGPLGEVVALPADALTPDTVRDADALLVRSVTKVGPALLGGSAVRFVATATIGVDHIDQAYLAGAGIGFASAAGSNARSVAEYVVAALLELAAAGGYALAGRTLGVVGVGNVGTKVARFAEALGMRVLRNDPPLQRETGDPLFVPREAVLAEADVVTLHVPLTREGPDATYHLADAAFFGRLRPEATLLNTSRGAVVDTDALKAALAGGHLAAAVLDVWEGEPEIDLGALRLAALATPHIAGYSTDGKVGGTRMCLAALCRHFGMERAWDPAPLMPPPGRPRVAIAADLAPQEALRQAVRAAYDIRADDARLRTVAEAGSATERRAFFTALRKRYPVRREFPETTAVLEADAPAARTLLAALDFPVENP